VRSAGAGQAQEARAAPMTSPPDSHRPVARQPKRAFREPDRQDHEHVHEQHRIPVSFRGIAPSSVVEAVWHGPSPESGKVVPLPRPPARRPTAGRPCARRPSLGPVLQTACAGFLWPRGTASAQIHGNVLATFAVFRGVAARFFKDLTCHVIESTNARSGIGVD